MQSILGSSVISIVHVVKHHTCRPMFIHVLILLIKFFKYHATYHTFIIVTALYGHVSTDIYK